MKKRILLLGAISAMAATALAITPNAAGVYEISTAAELEEFAAIVNGGNNSAKAVLTADIDMDGISHTPIANSAANPFKGTFDGRFHTISCFTMVDESRTNLALFGYVGSGAKISNTIIDDLSTIKGLDNVAAFVSEGVDTEVGVAEFTCLGTAAIIEASGTDDGSGRASGIAGSSDGNVTYVFTDCFNIGEIHGAKKAGAMSVHAPKATCKSCFTVTNVKVHNSKGAWANPSPVGQVFIAGVEELVGEWGYNFFFTSGTGTTFYPNIYDTGMKWTGVDVPYQEDNKGVYKVPESWASDGAMCWYLNDLSAESPVWGQDLEAGDNYPTFVPGTPVVVKNGDLFEFVNNGQVTTSGICSIKTDAHQGQDGIYTIEGIKVQSTDSHGFYIINGKKVLVK